METNPRNRVETDLSANKEVMNYLMKASEMTYDDLRNRVTKFLAYCDVASLFEIVKRQGERIFPSVFLAKEICRELADELGEKSAEEFADKCPDPESMRMLINKIKERRLLDVESIIRVEFNESIVTSFNIARVRAEAERVLQ